MIHVLPKILMWVVLVGGVYLYFGPNSFNSSGDTNPLGAPESRLFLPAAKPDRLVDYERQLADGRLPASAFPDYQALSREYQGNFWKDRQVSVEQALEGVGRQRADHLTSLLSERGLSDQEISIFFTVLQRDHPQLLQDRD